MKEYDTLMKQVVTVLEVTADIVSFCSARIHQGLSWHRSPNHSSERL